MGQNQRFEVNFNKQFRRVRGSMEGYNKIYRYTVTLEETNQEQTQLLSDHRHPIGHLERITHHNQTGTSAINTCLDHT